MADIFQVSTEINASPARVWEMLNTPKGLSHWFSDAATNDARVGGIFRFHGNFVVGSHDGADFSSKITAFEPERNFGFEFPLRLRDGRVLKGKVLFELQPAGSRTILSLSHEIENAPNEPKYYLNDLWSYYLNALTNACEHDYHEPGLLFDFSRPWMGNIKHVIYINKNTDEVFRALHDPQILPKYFVSAKMFEPKEEGKIDFGWGDEGPRRVLEWNPPIELSYDWPVHQDGDIHLGQVTWMLEPEGRATRLTMKQSGFGADVDHFRSGEALGWAAIMLDLKRLLESGRPALNQAGKYVS